MTAAMPRVADGYAKSNQLNRDSEEPLCRCSRHYGNQNHVYTITCHFRFDLVPVSVLRRLQFRFALHQFSVLVLVVVTLRIRYGQFSKDGLMDRRDGPKFGLQSDLWPISNG